MKWPPPCVTLRHGLRHASPEWGEAITAQGKTMRVLRAWSLPWVAVTHHRPSPNGTALISRSPADQRVRRAPSGQIAFLRIDPRAGPTLNPLDSTL
jgi:hypothetical protein